MAEFKVRGQTVLVDDEDLDLVKRIDWRVSKKGYVYSTVYLHRLVTGAPNNRQVDHGDRNKLNNRKSNLKHVTPRQNAANRGTKKTSRFAGVRLKNGKWHAFIHVKRKQIHLGVHPTEIDAAAAYNDAATKHFGQPEYLNQI